MQRQKHDTLQSVWRRNCRVTKITDRDNKEIMKDADNAKWANKQICSMLSDTEQKASISAQMIKLLSNDRIFRNSMQRISETNDVFNK